MEFRRVLFRSPRLHHRLGVMADGARSPLAARRQGRLPAACEVLDEALRRVLRHGRRLRHRAGLPVDRQSVVWGKRVSVRVDLGGRRIMNKKQYKLSTQTLMVNGKIDNGM